MADTVQNRVTWIPNALTRHSSAGTGMVLTKGGKLNAPLGLAVAPGGDVLTVNGNNGLIVETSPGGVAGGQPAAELDRQPEGGRGTVRPGHRSASGRRVLRR